jgi:APA family basic amino acid/polyamine antiporter
MPISLIRLFLGAIQSLYMAKLQQGLTQYSLTMVVIGSCLGLGIFLTPAEIAGILKSPDLVFLVWGIGGVVSIAGALTYAELGAMFPKAGGLYIFLREAYGNLFAFLYGWSVLTVSTTGAIAALALGFAEYVSIIFPMSVMAQQALAICAIALVSFINIRGIKFADLFTNLFTGTKILGILMIVVIAVMYGDTSVNFGAEAVHEAPKNLVTAIGLALIGVVFSYGGFHHASYVAAEVKNPKKAVPRAMIIGVLIIAVIYLLVNFAYMNLLPMSELMDAKGLASLAVGGKLLWGAGFVAILIAVSTFGTTGIYTLTAPRIYFAMAKDKVFFQGIAKLHPKYQTPMNAILLQSSWAVVLVILMGSFKNLVTFTVFIDWMFLALAAASIFVLRARQPRAERAFRTPLYPLTPIIFVGISAFILVVTLIERPDQALYGLILLACGLPLYFFVSAKNKKGNSSEK